MLDHSQTTWKRGKQALLPSATTWLLPESWDWKCRGDFLGASSVCSIPIPSLHLPFGKGGPAPFSLDQVKRCRVRPLHMNLQVANFHRWERAPVCQLLYYTTILFKVLYHKIKDVFLIFLCLFFMCEKFHKLPGSSPSRIQGNPQDEQRRREKTRRPCLDGAKSAREREKERERDQTRICSRVWQLLYFSL